MNLNKKAAALLLTVVLSVCLCACISPSVQREDNTAYLTDAAVASGSEAQGSTTESKNKDISDNKNSSRAQSTSEKKGSDKASGKTTDSSRASTEATKESSTTKGRTEAAVTSTTAGSTSRAEGSTGAASTTSQEICYLTIQYKEILSNMDSLRQGHEDYIKNNGIIADCAGCRVQEGDSVFDVLSRYCEANGIRLNVEHSAMGVYIAGINNLDERDCGRYSGWKYKVNGVFPSKSCDKIKVSKGDRIEFVYVCSL